MTPTNLYLKQRGEKKVRSHPPVWLPLNSPKYHLKIFTTPVDGNKTIVDQRSTFTWQFKGKEKIKLKKGYIQRVKKYKTCKTFFTWVGSTGEKRKMFWNILKWYRCLNILYFWILKDQQRLHRIIGHIYILRAQSTPQIW